MQMEPVFFRGILRNLSCLLQAFLPEPNRIQAQRVLPLLPPMNDKIKRITSLWKFFEPC